MFRRLRNNKIRQPSFLTAKNINFQEAGGVAGNVLVRLFMIVYLQLVPLAVVGSITHVYSYNQFR